MRTRNADAPKSAAAAKKKTPPARKPAAKSSPAEPSEAGAESVTQKIVETKRVASLRAKQMIVNQSTTLSDSEPQQPSGEDVEVSPSAKVGRATKSFARRTPLKTKTPALAKGFSLQTAELEEGVQVKIEELNTEVSEVAEVVEEEPGQHTAENTKESVEEKYDVIEAKEPVVECMEGSGFLKQRMVTESEVTYGENDVKKLSSLEVNNRVNEKEEPRDGEDKMLRDSDSSNIGENANEELNKIETEPVKVADVTEGMEYEEKVDLGEHEDEELSENVDLVDNAEETKALQDEESELKEIVKERKNRKECEVFVGGLDRDATEEDVRRVFEKMGEIVEIRLHKSLSTNKNRGYTFVEYAKKEYAKRALAEMKNPVIHGKRCGTAPSEDNDTLFLGNICNTWTKEAITQKLKDYGVEGVENITLVPDLQREWFSRGFAFVEFACHSDAMSAYKRLQKPDVIFGHPERTAKVAFAEPLRELDPDVMAQIKSVFVDGLPPHWDEVRVREQVKGYGEIIRICLARNMSTAKRNDFGFVDFSTHEAAIACVDGINNSQLYDGNSKMKLKARLSNPLPKTQAVKGGLCGGFRIGRSDGGFFRYGRGLGRGGNPFNDTGFPHGRGFYRGGRGRMGRGGFRGEYGSDNSYADFHETQMVGQGGRRGSFRGGRYSAGGVGRANLNRQWFGVPRERGMPYPPRRQPHSPEVHFDGPLHENHFDDPYIYGDGMHGMKRPSYVRDSDPDFIEPRRIRPRFDYVDPEASFHRSRYHDGYEAGSSLHSQDYYGPDYAGVPHSSFYEADYQPPYGRGYYY